MIVALVFGAPGSAWADDSVAATVTSAPGPLRLDGSLGGFANSGGDEGRGELRVRYHLFRYLDLAVQGRVGLLHANNRDAPGFAAGQRDQLVVALAVGPMLRGRIDPARWAAHGGLLLAHVHHASVDGWTATPGANLAGDSSGSVRHRSGLEAMIGLTTPTLLPLGRWRGFVSAEAVVAALPSSRELGWSGGLRLALGVGN